MEVCTYPGCGYRADFISKSHCSIHHDMKREEVFAKYGKPEKKKFNGLDYVIGKSDKEKEWVRSGIR